MLLPTRILSILFCALLATGCAGPASAPSEPVKLEPLGPVLASTPAREAWIEQAVGRDPVAKPDSKPALDGSTIGPRIAEMQGKYGSKLPPAYWALYRKNLETMQYELNHQADAPRAQYLASFRDELSRADDTTLQALATNSDKLPEPARSQWLERMKLRTLRYMLTANQSFRDITGAHLERMASMDRQYNACAVIPKCWDKP
ncbi:hypothetical protein [Pseudomonas sp. KNUC1026]|uniref:hypothetical protein n=1 Tax=Pseudomonas sp. KNUC1026 TaxID=2893890 RepID=UPI001F3DE7EF|nr:hypothetical protein [Pseudomonas sp. KNUC1026]UFH50435.1 hypothetical protein LN139_04090 [Pseudomonas sp. KNUC1026]